MTHKEYIRRLALLLGISETQARNVSAVTFGLVRDAVLEGNTVVMPQFGTFHPVQTKGGVRKVGVSTITVPDSTHIRFRSAKAAKERAE